MPGSIPSNYEISVPETGLKLRMSVCVVVVGGQMQRV